MLRVAGFLMRLLGRLLAGFLLLFVFAYTTLRLVRRYWHFPAPPYVALVLASPMRKALQPPAQVIQESGIAPGMVVLELGPGPGAFTIDIARTVGETGRVIAVDIQPRMIEMLRSAVERAGLRNVDIRLAGAYDLPAADASVDLALMVGVLAEIPDRQRALAEMKRVLKPESVLSISELVPDPDYPRPSTVIRWCERAGFRLAERHGHGLWYLLNFRKA